MELSGTEGYKFHSPTHLILLAEIKKCTKQNNALSVRKFTGTSESDVAPNCARMCALTRDFVNEFAHKRSACINEFTKS